MSRDNTITENYRKGRTTIKDGLQLCRFTHTSNNSNGTTVVMRVFGAGALGAPLHKSSSQKHSLPLRLLCDMHTWSTMNRLMRISDVHVRVSFTSAAVGRKET